MTGKLSFEDVLDTVMLEEPTPSHEALLRWSERYPEYRHALAEFFATWAIQKYRPEPEAEIDEEWIVQQGVNHAMDIVHRQGRLIAPESIQPLGDYDQLVLAAVYLLHGKGYAVTIAESVGEMSGRLALLGSIFTSLDRLERKALVSSRRANPETEPEGKHRRYFTVTLSGERALALAKQTSKPLADFLGDLA